jgi:predicted ATP-dependent Lon-type protease
VVNYLAEALRELRKHNFTESIDRHFSRCPPLMPATSPSARRSLAWSS